MLLSQPSVSPGEIFNRVTRTLPVRQWGSSFSKMKNCSLWCCGFCVDGGWLKVSWIFVRFHRNESVSQKQDVSHCQIPHICNEPTCLDLTLGFSYNHVSVVPNLFSLEGPLYVFKTPTTITMKWWPLTDMAVPIRCCRLSNTAGGGATFADNYSVWVIPLAAAFLALHATK